MVETPSDPAHGPPLPGDWEERYKGLAVLVTGGLGFIGSNVARRLVGLGAAVTLIDSMIPDCGANPWNVHDIESDVEIVRADLRDAGRVRGLVGGRALIFNLAGQVSHVDSMDNPLQDLEINGLSQISLLETCRRHNREAKIVYAGTRQQYGRPRYLPVDERHPLDPTDVNGINKAAAEAYHLLYHRVHGVRSTSLRLTNTYGPGLLLKHNRQGFLSVFVRLALEGKEIKLFGTGEQLRDLNYVDDVVDAFLRVGVAPWTDGEVYNLGGDERLSLADIAERLIRAAGSGSHRTVPFPENAKLIDIGSYYGSYEKIREAVGWSPRVPVDEGLARTLEYYRHHLDKYV